MDFYYKNLTNLYFLFIKMYFIFLSLILGGITIKLKEYIDSESRQGKILYRNTARCIIYKFHPSSSRLYMNFNICIFSGFLLHVFALRFLLKMAGGDQPGDFRRQPDAKNRNHPSECSQICLYSQFPWYTNTFVEFNLSILRLDLFFFFSIFFIYKYWRKNK
jgi:hypothetical protein